MPPRSIRARAAKGPLPLPREVAGGRHWSRPAGHNGRQGQIGFAVARKAQIAAVPVAREADERRHSLSRSDGGWGLICGTCQHVLFRFARAQPLWKSSPGLGDSIADN